MVRGLQIRRVASGYRGMERVPHLNSLAQPDGREKRRLNRGSQGGGVFLLT
jgi:hypothetical protein